MKKIDLVILCGGKGTRLGKLLKNNPKPMVPISGKPFLDYLINFYKKFPIQKIYLLAGFRGNKIKQKYHQKKFNFIGCEVLIEKKAMGTGGAILQLKKKIKNDFILINGDSYVEYPFKKLINIQKNSCLRMMLIENRNYKSNKKLISLGINRNNIVSNSPGSNKINAGIYYIKKNFLNNIKAGESSLENDILPKLIMQNKISGFEVKSSFIDIGTKKNLKSAKSFFLTNTYKPAVFLDRDGVLNYDYGYVHKYKNFKWMNGSLKALEYLNKKNFHIFVVTNQAGIGRGYYKELDLSNLHTKIKNFLFKKNIYLNEVVYCPHHPQFGKGQYKKYCKCRKPGNKLIEDLKKSWDIDLERSFMIGDKLTDELSAKKSNLKFYYREKNLFKQIKALIK